MKMRTKDLSCNFLEAALGSLANESNWCESLHRSTLLSMSACRRVLADGMHKAYWFNWMPDLEEDNYSPGQSQFVPTVVTAYGGY